MITFSKNFPIKSGLHDQSVEYEEILFFRRMITYGTFSWLFPKFFSFKLIEEVGTELDLICLLLLKRFTYTLLKDIQPAAFLPTTTMKSAGLNENLHRHVLVLMLKLAINKLVETVKAQTERDRIIKKVWRHSKICENKNLWYTSTSYFFKTVLVVSILSGNNLLRINRSNKLKKYFCREDMISLVNSQISLLRLSSLN